MASLTDEWAIVAHLVDRFESQRQSNAQAKWSDFLPERAHPLFAETAAELVRVDLEYAWKSGQRRRLEEYRGPAPELFHNRELLGGPAYEEYRQRRLAGDSVDRREYRERYGVDSTTWPEGDPTERSNQPAVENFPAAGQSFCGFKLLSEIGRGAFARVMLAEQQALAHRPVVLKLSSGRSLEPQHLARLQHTHVMPIYSVHEADGLVGVVMPYFGQKTLADLLRHLGAHDGRLRSGQDLLSTLVAKQDDTVVGDRPQDSHRNPRLLDERPVDPQLQKMSYVDAVLTLVSDIAAGLGHAHERGIVHRDVKPANILLADDGRPLVLDFNLSDDVVVNGRPSLTVGGTLPYMAPEHLLAVVEGGRVGPASDLYSVGTLLFELLTGRRPYSDGTGATDEQLLAMRTERLQLAPRVTKFNPSASPAVAEIVAKCLAPTPTERYGSLALLQEDLSRQLRSLPLRHAANPSWRERFAKWRRRHPRLVSATTVGAAAAVLVTCLASAYLARGAQLARATAHEQYHTFVQESLAGRMALGAPSGEAGPIKSGAAEVRKLLAPFAVSAAKVKQQPFYQHLSAAERSGLADRLTELNYLLARGEQILARGAASEKLASEHRTAALECNARAQEWGDAEAQSALELQRSVLEGRPDPGALLSSITAPQAEFLAAQELLARGRFAEAAPLLESLAAERPTDPVVWLLRGYGEAARGQLAKAEGSYTTAAALGSDSNVGNFNRGLCRYQQGDFNGAAADFSVALGHSPTAAYLLLNRALALSAAGNIPEALADLDAALALPDCSPRAYLLRSQLRLRGGDRAGAAEDLAKGIAATPEDDVGWVARGVAQLGDKPQAALEDFQRALEVNPRSVLALQNIVHVAGDRLQAPRVALAAFEKWLSMDAQNPNALIGRAVLRGRTGERVAALGDVETALASSQQPMILFQAACALSLTSAQNSEDAPRALEYLTQAIEAAPALAARAEADPDLAACRKLEAYRDLKQARASWDNAKSRAKTPRSLVDSQTATTKTQ